LHEFIDAVFTYGFMQRALLAGLLASIACGVIGTYVVTRRISYIAGSIAHCVLGGIGAARYLQTVHNWQSFHPLHGAIVAALLAAVTIGFVSLKARQREDTVIGALWAAGMAVGILFIARTPGYNEDLMSYLFGNILMVGPRDLWLIGILDAVVIIVGLLLYKPLLAVCFDEEFARARGLPADMLYILLLCLTALAVVLLVQVVGIILVIALLTLPAAVSGFFSRSLWQMMIFSTVLSLVFTVAGLGLSYSPNLPPGATIILVAGAVYLFTTFLVAILRRLLH
jgi:zinc transport system permease protein